MSLLIYSRSGAASWYGPHSKPVDASHGHRKKHSKGIHLDFDKSQHHGGVQNQVVRGGHSLARITVNRSTGQVSAHLKVKTNRETRCPKTCICTYHSAGSIRFETKKTRIGYTSCSFSSKTAQNPKPKYEASKAAPPKASKKAPDKDLTVDS